ncbi:MAG: 13E12 repeat family protein [Propionibacteriaceae bacterium]|nr:13E12 repeat family protein [Propionibacteriaceae bacterium]
MFDNGEWLVQARTAMADYAACRRMIDLMEAEAARLLAHAIDAYTWPVDQPEPDRFDTYRVEHIDGRAYGEDMISELAVANSSSAGAAHYLACDVATLARDMPQCWAKVVDAQAPLWQARKVAQACQGVMGADRAVVDVEIAPCLGAVGMPRLTRAVTAAVLIVDPDRAERIHQAKAHRCVLTGADEKDPLTGWVSARVDRQDAIYLDAMIQLVADRLAARGDATTVDHRRARALGMLANPAAVVQMIGIPTTRGMDSIPTTDEDYQAIKDTAGTMVAGFTPRTQVYVHLFAVPTSPTKPTSPTAGICPVSGISPVARVEALGPILTSQVAQLTSGTHVRVTPAIHVDSTSFSVDQYEVPARLRHQVVLRNPYDVFPWSSIESRNLDLDHTIAFQVGQPGQTNPSNLGPVSRRAHRIKTVAGWQLDQPTPGVYIWRTPTGQTIQVDHTGTHHIITTHHTTGVPEPAPP